jgi:hypothetical protein
LAICWNFVEEIWSAGNVFIYLLFLLKKLGPDDDKGIGIYDLIT